MSLLAPEALPHIPAAIARPEYDRSTVGTGIVHFGPGAFHRAHQAAYIDRVLRADPRWGIAAVSMRSADTVEALGRQNGLYTLAILDAEPSFRVLGPHQQFLGPRDGAAVRRLLSEPRVRIVSSTVTEKGYCLSGDGTLDFNHPDILHDLSGAGEPRSLIGWLVKGLADRRAAAIAPFSPLCCDNMADNGRKLGAAVIAFAERTDPELAGWIGGEVRFPNAMVDSITPATDEATREAVRQALGFVDAIPVQREAYAAWIIEDVLPADGPDLAGAGAVLTSDVAAFERAKLRILNGSHSSLAYLGLLLGHDTVAGAMRDAALAGFVARMAREDIVPGLDAGALDGQAYVAEVLARFRNPAIGHKLSQIAWDGSQKLPYRLLDTIAEALAAGRPVERLIVPIAAWMAFIARRARAGAQIIDPLGDQLVEIGRSESPPASLLALRQVFPASLADNPAFRDPLLTAYAMMQESGVRSVIGADHG